MKLLTFVLALSCIIAYTTADQRGQYWPTNTKIFTTSHRFRREANLPSSTVANLKSTPQLSFDDNENLRLVLFDNEPDTTVYHDEGNDVVTRSESQPNAQLHSMYRIDENDYLGAYTFHPGAYGGFAQNFGTGGGFRWRRDVEPLFEVETQRDNGFITGFMEFQRGANGRRIEPTVGATTGIPVTGFWQEADQIEKTNDEIAEMY
ncbi:uncharacterized protein LOC105196875 [Solenopsis invicta]|uniref:uncharacterized protein LOC105196875 n=1 Tax=Solenopsis invicta TaxID=13686 RepID=UPI000595DF48|nr:uncharacterized protein LOC105196875 [Solenopsis invicta]